MKHYFVNLLRMGDSQNTPPIRKGLRGLLLAFFVLMGVSLWATDIVIDLDLSTAATYPSGFPTASGTKTGTYTLGGYDFSFSCNDAFYFSTSYLMIGKSSKTVSSYITFPAIEDYKLTEVKLTASSGTSTNVAASIQDGSGNVLTGGTGWAFVQSGSNTWTLTETSANTAYKVCIYKNNTNNSTYNAQVAGLKLTYSPTGSTPVTPTCATPTFSPASGSYEGTQNVTISSTAGATIYYTTDGTTPSTGSSVYSAAIPVSANTTIKAYAVKDSYDDSEVATAAYEITEGPDVTLNLIDGNWGFPTSNTTEDGTYTNSVSGYSVTCHAPTNYKVSGSDYFFIGKSGAYILLPEFTSPIEKIVVSGNSGGAADVAWNIYQGETAVSTAASGCKNDAYTFDIAPANQKANVAHSIKVTNAKNLQIKVIKIYFGEAPAIEAPSISGDVNFVGSTTVTISHDDADHIYYTTNGVDPTTSSTEYTAPFVVNADGTTTVKAIAVKGSDVSAVAEKTFTKVEALESLAALLEATTSSETAFNVVVTNWVVTGVNGSRAWIADAANEKGILLYKSGHNFVAGNKLNGVVIGTKSKLYQGYPEMTTLVSTDVTVTTAEAITPRVTTIAALTSGYPNEQGTVVKLENLTYTASTTSFSDGVNTLALNTQLYNPTMLDGAIYTIIGVVRYDDEAAISIMPRSVDDVEQTGGGGMPEVTGLAALKAEATGTSYLLNLTNAIVTLVDGSNAFIEDATAGALIYKSGHGFSAGDKLNGQYEVTTATYQGKFEITAIAATTGTKTTGAEIPVTTLTIAQLNANFAANESKRIKIVGVNVTDAVESGDATARTGEISDGENTITLYAGKSGVTAAENANIDVIGYPTFHNTDQQLAVWAQTDITVNEKEDPELAYDPVSETIEQGASWSAPTLTNPHSLTIASYASNNESVATVTGEGVIALAGGLGTAVITAHTDGDATYAAGNATYTITVNEAGTYSMSFDLSRASYDDAADEEVVWNSNVVTITAQKNTGTKVTNYLAGNYSSGTLIAETRLYENNILAFTPKAGVTITKVEWHATAKAYAESLAKEGTTTAWTNATAALDGTDDKLVIITPSAAGEFSAVLGKSGSNKGTRALNVVVFYTAESEKAKLTASISIDDMNMAVGDDDILLSAIAATSNPNKKAISYEITSGTAVTIEGTGAEAALHAAAAGSATITATIPDDLGNYTGATASFTVTVSAAATLESIAISGTATELEYTEGQSFNPAGLTVMGHYSNGSDAEITEGIDWTFDPDPLTEGTTSVSVTATVETISSDAIVVNGLTVSGPAPVGDNYVKVTASQADWSGDYILVYEDGTDAYVWNGDYNDAASNYALATISSNTIAKPAAAAVITIAAASEGKYTLQVNDDKYFQDNGSNSKLIFTDAIADAAEVTISYETDWTKLLFSERCIRFNSSSGQTRFRFYAADGQQKVQLYKKETPEPPTPVYETVRSGLECGRHYTVCLAKNITHIEGATFWNLTYRNNAGTEAYLVGEDAPEAGKPYIFQATAETLRVVYGEETAGAPVANGALVGTFEDLDAAALNTINETGENDIYMLFNNELRPIGTNNHLDAHRAYVLYNLLQEVPAAGFAPGKKVKRMPMQGQTTTDCELINAAEAPVKMMINGQLYILRGEKKYDATGRLVK